MKLVIDASVAVKWVVEEDGRDQARRLVADTHQLLAPDFVLVEVGNTLWKKVRLNELGRGQAMDAIDEIGPSYDRLLSTSELAPQALALSLALDHPVYDCLYLAAAEQEDAVLVTADSKFRNKLEGTRHRDRVAMLGDVD